MEDSSIVQLESTLMDVRQLLDFNKRAIAGLEDQVESYETYSIFVPPDSAQVLKDKYTELLTNEANLTSTLQLLSATVNELRNDANFDMKRHFDKNDKKCDVSRLLGDQRYMAFELKLQRKHDVVPSVANASTSARPDNIFSFDIDTVSSSLAATTQGSTGADNVMDLDEEDVASGHVPSTFRDPITMTQIKDPVKNRFCGHIYDRASIQNFIIRTLKPMCPYVGCPNKRPLNLKYLDDDEETMRILAQQK